jgi:ABC-type lipoprotein export system ATPase subunit
MQQFAKQVTRSGAACLMVTHSVAAASHTHRLLVLTDTGITEPEPTR